MKRMVLSAIVLTGIVLFAPLALAVERNVPSEYATIQAAINACTTGDVVIIAPGTYTGTGNKDLDFAGKAITVRSADPNNPDVVAATVINCEGSNSNPHRGFYFHSGERANSIVMGLRITNGYGPNANISGLGSQSVGGSVFCNNSGPTILKCKINGNAARYGGGICCYGTSSPTISHCIITGNNTFNYGAGAGINCMGGNATVKHCVIYGNTCSSTGGLCCNRNSNITIHNSIVWNNSSPYQLSVSTWDDGDHSHLTVSYSDIMGGQAGVAVGRLATLTWGAGNINSDPFFAYPENGNYHLSASSPCIDAGDPCYISGGETDIDGDARVFNGRVDIGADEFIAGTPRFEVLPAEFELRADKGGPNPEAQIMSIKNVGLGALNWNVAEDCSWATVEPNKGRSTGEIDEVTVTVDVNGLTSGKYVCNLTISDPCAENSPQIVGITLYVSDYDGKLYVPSEYGTIQTAVDVALDGDIIIVAPGTYTGDGNRDLDFGGKVITVQSTNPEDPCVVAATVVDCQGSQSDRHRGFRFHSGEGVDSIVAGITIINGAAPTVDVFDYGGAIVCDGASPTIRYCILSNNWAIYNGYGGGICCLNGSGANIENCTINNNNAYNGGGGIASVESNPIIINCIIKDNGGGGIYCSLEGTVTIKNCLIEGNGNDAGGGIRIHGISTINNCIILNNSSFEGGGIFIGYGSTATEISNCSIIGNSAKFDTNFPPTGYGGGLSSESASGIVVRDCIFWDNTADVAGQQFYGEGFVVTYSDIQCGYAGTGNINADPCFVSGPLGNYYLSQIAAGQAANSPCVGAGSDTAENLEMNSLTTRIDQIADTGVADMGYHYPAAFNIDLNGDGFINFIDFAIFANDWQQASDPCNPKSSDIYKDGQVDIYDLALLVKDWCLTVEIEPNVPSGLVGWWTFDEGSGTVANDSVSGNNGTIYGGQWVTGKVGDYALDITTGSYVEIPDNDLLTPADEMTLAFWAYRRGEIMLGKMTISDNLPANVNSYGTWLMSDVQPFFIIYSSVTDSEWFPGVSLIPSYEWHHVAMTFNRGDVKIYIDGILDNSGTVAATSIINDDLPFIIGGMMFYNSDGTSYPTAWMDGIIDDLRIYNRELEQQEVQTLYQLGQ